MRKAPDWSDEQLQQGRTKATEIFRQSRMEEPLEAYLEFFDEYQGKVEELLETSVDLTQLEETLEQIAKDKKLMEAFRYLAGPPISADDLKVVAEANLSRSRMLADPEMAKRVLAVVQDVMDRRRFPWVKENREPTEAERSAAVIASAALIANSKVGTSRRNEGKKQQEELVRQGLIGRGFKELKTP